MTYTRNSLRLFACAALTLACGNSAARADDWLVSLTACAPSDAKLALVYPRAGLPAVVAAGDQLVARVRVPAAMTPPPGVQQEKVLRSWGADLMGEGIPLGAERDDLSSRYTLAARNLRPDSSASLVYRVALAVPAYVAPGTYHFYLRTPFGRLGAEASVRVIAVGATPRLARLPAGMHPPLPAELAVLPVDVWIEDAPAPAGLPSIGTMPSSSLFASLHAQPWLAADSAGVELGTSTQALLSRPCGSTVPPPSAAAAPALVASSELSVIHDARTLVIDDRGTSTLELPLLIAPGFIVRAQNAKLELQPAGDVRARRPSALAARLTIVKGSSGRVTLEPAAAVTDLSIVPTFATAGHALTLRVLGAPRDARVAFDLDPGQSAWGGSQLAAMFSAPGGHHVAGLVFLPDGAVRSARGQLWVDAEQPRAACSVSAPGGAPTRTAVSLFQVLFAAVCLLKRRARP